MAILAIDYGAKRIGLAKSDKLGFGVWPLPPLHCSNNSEEDLNKLLDLIKEEEISKIVIGLPLSEEGLENDQCAKIKKFAKKLEQALEIESLFSQVFFQNERHSSWEASERLQSLGYFSNRKKQKLDSIAALVILEDFLKK